MLWESLFMLVVLKIPVVYLCCVVWWAIRAEPHPLEGAVAVRALAPDPTPGCRWSERRRSHGRRRPRPRPTGRRTYALARAGARR